MRALKGNFSILQLFVLAFAVAGGCMALTQADRFKAPVLLAHSILAFIVANDFIKSLRESPQLRSPGQLVLYRAIKIVGLIAFSFNLVLLNKKLTILGYETPGREICDFLTLITYFCAISTSPHRRTIKNKSAYFVQYLLTFIASVVLFGVMIANILIMVPLIKLATTGILNGLNFNSHPRIPAERPWELEFQKVWTSQEFMVPAIFSGIALIAMIIGRRAQGSTAKVAGMFWGAIVIATSAFATYRLGQADHAVWSFPEFRIIPEELVIGWATLSFILLIPAWWLSHRLVTDGEGNSDEPLTKHGLFTHVAVWLCLCGNASVQGRESELASLLCQVFLAVLAFKAAQWSRAKNGAVNFSIAAILVLVSAQMPMRISASFAVSHSYLLFLNYLVAYFLSNSRTISKERIIEVYAHCISVCLFALMGWEYSRAVFLDAFAPLGIGAIVFSWLFFAVAADVIPKINLRALKSFFVSLPKRWVSLSILVGIVIGVGLALLSRRSEAWRFLTIDFEGLTSGNRISVLPILLTEFWGSLRSYSNNESAKNRELQKLEFSWSRFWWAWLALVVMVPPLAVSWFWGLSYLTVRILTPL
ncbi:MAG: hypothetical protein ABL888_18860 [Pirellulaceae bacterium]